MADMKRTTGGLLEGQQRSITPTDFQAAVEYLEQHVQDAAIKQALGLDMAKRYAAAPVNKAADAQIKSKPEVLDLQRQHWRIAR